jgi:hypothetical protein
MVDMVFTRSGDLARIKVAVLDPKKIPETLQVVFGKYLHAIYFILEEGEGSSEHVDDGLDNEPMDEDDDLLGEEEELGKSKDAPLGGGKSGSADGSADAPKKEVISSNHR